MNYRIKLPPDLVGRPTFDTDDLTRILPYTSSGIYALVRQGAFPTPRRFGAKGKKFWDAEEVMDTVQAAAANSKAA